MENDICRYCVPNNIKNECRMVFGHFELLLLCSLVEVYTFHIENYLGCSPEVMYRLLLEKYVRNDIYLFNLYVQPKLIDITTFNLFL